MLAAIAAVPRELFVPEDLRLRAYDDRALPIGHGQTISQPFMVATICAALELDADARVLDVGTGSGYQAAVLAEIAAEVVTIERVPELADRARETLARAGYERVEVRVGDGTLGVPDRAPFDGIAVAAAAPAVPDTLYEQLSVGGRVVAPGRQPPRPVAGGRRAQGRRSQGRAVGSVPIRPARRRGRVRRIARRVTCCRVRGHSPRGQRASMLLHAPVFLRGIRLGEVENVLARRGGSA